MTMRQLALLGALLLIGAMPMSHLPAAAQEARNPYVRLAELDIDPAQIEAFKAAIREGIEASVRLEPDVLVLYAVLEKDMPNRVRVFEVYSNEAAYRIHLETAHFRKFRDTTAHMVRSRRLLDADPIILGAKAK